MKYDRMLLRLFVVLSQPVGVQRLEEPWFEIARLSACRARSFAGIQVTQIALPPAFVRMDRPDPLDELSVLVVQHGESFFRSWAIDGIEYVNSLFRNAIPECMVDVIDVAYGRSLRKLPSSNQFGLNEPSNAREYAQLLGDYGIPVSLTAYEVLVDSLLQVEVALLFSVLLIH